jgi:prepilin-type N-terminal cleavage/methylation domain-containing protein
MFKSNKFKYQKGFTLVEILVGTAVFVILAMSVYQAFTTTMNVVRLSRVKITATALANEQIEIIRNLPYTDVGIVNGIPLGKIPATQNLERDGKDFGVQTIIRNIDDPFDGTIGGTPNDTSPADYKLVEIEITCDTCRNFSPLSITTYVAPKALESASDNGALFVKVFDASGQPIPLANIHIENNQTNPLLDINEVTDNNGLLQIVDAPPSTQSYNITVSKDGYSTEQTLPVGMPENPSPIKPHSTVLVQQLTEISFMIDKVSTLNIQSVNHLCEAVPHIPFSLQGQKLIGSEPDILKYENDLETNEAGLLNISDLEWDTYTLSFTAENFQLLNITPTTTLDISPDMTQEVKIIAIPKSTKDLFLTVTDSVTSLPIAGASVELTAVDFSDIKITSEVTDCSSGGITLFSDLTENNYNIKITKDGYAEYIDTVETANPWQEITINLNP